MSSPRRSLVSRLNLRSSRDHRRAKLVPRRKLHLESLETRALLAGDFGFAHGFGSTGREVGYSVVADSQGNVYMTGEFRNTVDFDPGPAVVNLVGQSSERPYTVIAKYSATGSLVWAKSLSSSNMNWGRDLALDAAGNLWVTGLFFAATDFDPGVGQVVITPRGGGVENYLLKLDADGNYLTAGAFQGGLFGGVAADAAGNVYLTGQFGGAADLDPGLGVASFTSRSTYPDAFISKLDSEGNLIWAKTFGGPVNNFNGDYGQDIAVDDQGSPYVTGVFLGTVDFDPGPGTAPRSSTETSAIFTTKFDTNGDFQWVAVIDSPGTTPEDIAVDAQGNVVVTGALYATVDFDPGAGVFHLTAPSGFFGAYVTKLTAAGSFQWAKQLGGLSNGGTYGYGLTLGPSGDIYSTGQFSGTGDFDPGAASFTLASAGSIDVYVSKLASDGSFVSARRIGGTGLDRGRSVAANDAGVVFVTGQFNGTADFDPGADTVERTSAGSDDIFLVKLFTSPYFTSAATFSVSENTAQVATLAATDPEGQSVTYSIDGGVDAGLFSINSETGELSFTSPPDFESFTHGPAYAVRVSASDGINRGLLSLVIAVTDFNEAPTDVALQPAEIAENQVVGTTVGTFSTTDADVGDSFIYSLISGTGDDDNSQFTIDGSILKSTTEFNFEGQSSYSIRVLATDNSNLSIVKAFTIAIEDLNEAGPTDITLNPAAVLEDQVAGTVIGALSTTDADLVDSFTYAFAAGEGDDDNDQFRIQGSTLKAAAEFDYESKSSYTIRVLSTDRGNLSTVKVLTVSVGDVNEGPTNVAIDSLVVNENQAIGTTIGTFSTQDVDATDSFAYTLVSGEGSDDNDQFTIDGITLKTATAFDREVKNSYSIRVLSTDSGNLSTAKVFTLSVGDLNEGPTNVTLAPTIVSENQVIGTAVGTFGTEDVDAQDSFTYTLVSGAGDDDNNQFSIDGSTLKTAALFDLESKSSYQIRVRTTDSGNLSLEQTFVISVVNLNEAPTALQLSAVEISENLPSGSVVGTITTTDPDAGNTFSFTMAAGAGDSDNGSFEVDALGRLVTKASLDYELQSSYSVRVRSTDQEGLFTEQDFTISVSDVNEGPNALALAAAPVAENLASGTEVGSFSSTDVDANNTFTYTLIAGEGDGDNGSFTIDDSTLKTAASFDFETKGSYSVRIRSTDAGGLFTEQNFTITVSNVNEGPTALALSAATVAENSASGVEIGILGSTDVDAGDTFTYTLVAGDGDSDNGAFTIDGSTLRTAASFDFETKSTYSVRVRSTDAGGVFTEETFTITVTDSNDAPVLNTALAPKLRAVAEDSKSAYGTPIGELLAGASDADAGSPKGMAITWLRGAAIGTWQYTLDDGTTWQAVGSVSRATALLLPVNGTQTRLRFIPQPNFTGPVELGFRAWDQTQGAAGEKVNLLAVSSHGGSTAFSRAMGPAVLVVTPVNDAPVLNNPLTSKLRPIKEGTTKAYGTPVAELLGGVGDIDARAKQGLAVTWANGTANGQWQYTLNNGSTWQAFGSVSADSALLLPANGNFARIRFVPQKNFAGTVKLGYRAWDQTQGTAGDHRDLSAPSSRGGITAFSTAARPAALTVAPVNDPPVLAINGSVGYTLNAAAIVLANQARLIDVDRPNFQGGKLTLSITSGADVSNRLEIGGAFTRVRNEIRLNGTTIATINAGGGAGTTDLVLSLNHNATSTNVQQLLRSITFRMVSGTSTAQRVVSFTLTDGDGGTSVTKTRTVNVGL
jgi:hypothetical protein